VNLFLGFLLIALGEGFSIYAEASAVKRHLDPNHVRWCIFVITLGGLMLVPGYIVLYRAFGDIWQVSVVSIVLILVLEPVIVWSLFREMPSLGSIIGFVCGSVGFAFTVFMK